MEQKDIATAPQPGDALGLVLADEIYVRQRIAPKLSDENFLAFTDLFRAVTTFSKEVRGRVFDYGCGGAPYQKWFEHCEAYIRADVTPGVKVDRLLSPDGLTDEKDASYDAVFSAQVLEHVKNPAPYISECFRILKPGGQLFLSTHGTFEEHGCPYDFQRWTAIGLEEMVKAAGFKVLESHKLTSEVRGVLQSFHYFALHLRFPGRPMVHYPFAVFRRFYRWFFVPALNWLGSFLPEQGIVPANDPATLYIGVCVRAQKASS